MNIITDYEAAFLRANGYACKVLKTPRGGWYIVHRQSNWGGWAPLSPARYRLGELPELTGNLNSRFPFKR